MSAGYVYVLINQSMPGLIKVGRTYRDSRLRARQLSTTGVPTPFEVAFELFSLQHQELEKKVHLELASFRVSNNREFFRYPLKDAIELMLQIGTHFDTEQTEFVAESIFSELSKKYPRWLKPNITDVRIVQTPERVWQETTEEEEYGGELKDQFIRRSDLAFISDGPDFESMFLVKDTITVNSRKFVDDIDPFTIIMTTELFHADACEEVNHKFNPHRRRTSHHDSNNLE